MLASMLHAKLARLKLSCYRCTVLELKVERMERDKQHNGAYLFQNLKKRWFRQYEANKDTYKYHISIEAVNIKHVRISELNKPIRGT